MHIQIAEEPFINLTAWWIVSGGMEFSGLGLVEREMDVLHVVGVDLLNIGSFGYTEIPDHRQRALPLDPRRKLWFHRHPCGRAEPGPNNWSGTDHNTAERTPLGGIPELVQWSTSMVYTPTGWTGRVDVYLPKLRTFYIPVLPTIPTEAHIEQARELLTPELITYAAELRAEFDALMAKRTHIPSDMEWMDGDDLSDDDFYRVRYDTSHLRFTKARRRNVPIIIRGGRNIFTRYYEELE